MATTLSDKELLRKLVSFDSTSARSNAPIAEFACEYLDRPGIMIDRITNGEGTKINLIARTGPSPSGEREAARGLVLSGHFDVVPAKEPEWTSDPFNMIEANGQLIGRGACDMKGSVALAMNALVDASGQSLKHPLVVLLSYDEEVGSLGAARMAEKWGSRDPLPRNVVIGEPTSLKAVRMHKGHLKLKVTIKGKAAHSGTPQLGVNAIELATRVLERLVKLKDQLETEHCETSTFFPEVPFVALNIARITGGDAINVVPDRCVIDLGVRPLPGLESQPLIERVQDAVARANVPAELLKFELVNDSPPMLLREEATVYRTLREMLSQKQSLGVSFSTDGGVLTRRMGLDCVLFGPGSMATAHQANESLPIAELERAAPILRRLIQRLCME